MKKISNHTKRPDEKWEGYDENDYASEDYENTDGEYYAEDGEYYAEDGVVEGEYYAEEGTADGEYYAEEGATEGEYYAEEGTADGEYYAEEGTADGVYYAEEGVTEGEYYAEEGEYYAEDDTVALADTEEGGWGDSSDDEFFSGEILYREDGIEYPEDDVYVADEEIDPEEEDDYEAPVGFLDRLKNISLMDTIVAMTGILVLALVVITGFFYLSSKKEEGQVSGLITVGNQLSNITMIGESGLSAIADAQIAKLEAANKVEKEEETNPGYEENEYERTVSVVLNLTTIQKDLKIKFVNKNTSKLVPNVPFTVSIIDPNGKSVTWSDDDMDGIIYKKDIEAGTYEITMDELTDEKYAEYGISSATKSIVVKKDISYQKVDIANEVKKESEVDASKEDTKKNETQQESALKDTVTWVESKVTTATYNEISKNDIPDPVTIIVARLSKGFTRMALTATGVNSRATVAIGKTITLQPQGTVVSDDVNEVVESDEISEFTGITWTSADTSIATVDPSTGVVTGVKEGTVEISFSGTAIVNVDKKTQDESSEESSSSSEESSSSSEESSSSSEESSSSSEESSSSSEETPASSEPSSESSEESGSEPSSTPGSEESSSEPESQEAGSEPEGTSTEAMTTPVSGKYIVTVTAEAKLEFDAETLGVVVKGTNTVQTTAKGAPENATITYKVTSDKTNIATATVDAKGKITVTGVAKGEAVLTVTATTADGYSATGTITAKVSDGKVIQLESSAAYTYLKELIIIRPRIVGASTKEPDVKITSSDETILKASLGGLAVDVQNSERLVAPVVLEGIKEGSATVTIKCTENGETVTATVTVTVKPNPKDDVKTVLKSKDGLELYVYENKTYRKASSADYYKFDKFYVSGGEKYTGWQTLNGKVYFFQADGKAVTGEQVIQGAKYTFASDGSLVTGSGINGIDVSKWNGTIDWTAVKNSGIDYVIIRCGYRGSSKGTLIEDPKFTTNIKGAIAANIKVGVYFFSQAIDEREAVEEASMVIEQIKNYKISYPVFIDVESSGGRADSIDSDTRTAVVTAFCNTIKSAGYTPGVYANNGWFEKKMDVSAFKDYKIWLAQYASTPTFKGRYDMWQYRSTGKVSGISGDVDMNISYLGY